MTSRFEWPHMKNVLRESGRRCVCTYDCCTQYGMLGPVHIYPLMPICRAFGSKCCPAFQKQRSENDAKCRVQPLKFSSHAKHFTNLHRVGKMGNQSHNVVYGIRMYTDIIGIRRMRVRFTPQSMTAATEVRCKRVRIRASMRQIHLWIWRPKHSHRRFALVAFICSMKGTWTRTQHSRTHRRGKEMGGVYNAWEILVSSWLLPSQSMMIKWWYLPGEWRVEWRRRFSYCMLLPCSVLAVWPTWALWKFTPPCVGVASAKGLAQPAGPLQGFGSSWPSMEANASTKPEGQERRWFILIHSVWFTVPCHAMSHIVPVTFQKA